MGGPGPGAGQCSENRAGSAWAEPARDPLGPEGTRAYPVLFGVTAGVQERMQQIFVGDVQGCADELDELLARARDAFGDGFELWVVGDLVNRGPDNLRPLERVRELVEQGRAHYVLGLSLIHI